MSRACSGTAQNAISDNHAVTGVPRTIACWFNPDVATGSRDICGVSATGEWGHYDSLATFNASAYGQSRGPSGGPASSNAGVFGAGAWSFGANVVGGDASRTGFLNGVLGIENTTGVGARTTDRLWLGGNPEGGGNSFFDGLVAHLMIFDYVLSEADLDSLAGGTNPLALTTPPVEYFPLVDDNFDNAGTGSATMSNNGTTYSSSNPTVDPPPASGIDLFIGAITAPPVIGGITVSPSGAAPVGLGAISPPPALGGPSLSGTGAGGFSLGAVTAPPPPNALWPVGSGSASVAIGAVTAPPAIGGITLGVAGAAPVPLGVLSPPPAIGGITVGGETFPLDLGAIAAPPPPNAISLLGTGVVQSTMGSPLPPPQIGGLTLSEGPGPVNVPLGVLAAPPAPAGLDPVGVGAGDPLQLGVLSAPPAPAGMDLDNASDAFFLGTLPPPPPIGGLGLSQQDVTPPGQVTGLALSEPVANTLRASFTMPSDPDTAAYKIQWQLGQGNTWTSHTDGTTHTGETAAGPGQAVVADKGGFNPGQRYELAVFCKDTSGNWNVASGGAIQSYQMESRPAAPTITELVEGTPLAYYEDFANPAARANFTAIEGSESDWVVSGGLLRMVNGNAFGTLAYDVTAELVDRSLIVDYRTGVAPAGAGIVGIVPKVVDAQNYVICYFELDDRKLVIRQVVGGVPTDLASTGPGGATTPSTSYNLYCVMQGNSITFDVLGVGNIGGSLNASGIPVLGAGVMGPAGLRTMPSEAAGDGTFNDLGVSRTDVVLRTSATMPPASNIRNYRVRRKDGLGQTFTSEIDGEEFAPEAPTGPSASETVEAVLQQDKPYTVGWFSKTELGNYSLASTADITTGKPDTDPPAVVSDLALSEPSSGFIRANFTAPADPDTFIYKIRWQAGTGNTWNWHTDGNEFVPDTNVAPSQPVSVDRSGFTPESQYEIAVFVRDVIGNWNIATSPGAIQSITLGTAPPPPPTSDYDSQMMYLLRRRWV